MWMKTKSKKARLLSCPECESELEVSQTHPVHLNLISDDLDEEDDDDEEEGKTKENGATSSTMMMTRKTKKTTRNKCHGPFALASCGARPAI